MKTVAPQPLTKAKIEKPRLEYVHALLTLWNLLHQNGNAAFQR